MSSLQGPASKKMPGRIIIIPDQPIKDAYGFLRVLSLPSYPEYQIPQMCIQGKAASLIHCLIKQSIGLFHIDRSHIAEAIHHGKARPRISDPLIIGFMQTGTGNLT